MSRLYPGWGSGKHVVLEEQFAAHSLACLGREELEGGDKVIMSQSTFRKVSRARLPFPLTFKVANAKSGAKAPGGGAASELGALQRKPTGKAAPMPAHAAGGKGKSTPGKATPGKVTEGGSGSSNQAHEEAPAMSASKKKVPLDNQYCGVLEFSGPEEKVFLPHWMMQNLRIKEGQKVTMTSVVEGQLPRGTFCKLRPHTTAFIDLAASMDLRDLLEAAFRNYSVLSAGETIVVTVAGDNYKIDVLETKPENAISLYGSLDLEVDFAAPLDGGSGSSGSGGASGGASADARAPPATQLEEDDEQRAAAPAGANVMSFAQVMQFMQERDKAAAGTAASSTNQVPSPIDRPAVHNWGQGRSLSGAQQPAPENKPEAPGKATISKAATPLALPAAAEASTAEPQVRARRRNPTKFAQRVAGSSFTGDGAPLSPTLQAETVREGAAAVSGSGAHAAAPSISTSVFTGAGRTLQGGVADQITPTNKPSAAAEAAAIRARRLQFLDKLAPAQASPSQQPQQPQQPQQQPQQQQLQRRQDALAGASAAPALMGTAERPSSSERAHNIAVGSSLNAIRKAKR